MKRIIFILLLIVVALNSKSQDTSKINIKKLEITVGTFSTLSESGKISVNPVILGNWGDYYYENRYCYEASNSTSINAGKRVLKKIKHAEIIPMIGLILGSFKGLTAELQTSLDYNKWIFLTDNQYSYEYTEPKKSLYFNWTVARYKVTNYLHVGLTTLFDKRVDKAGVFDKGATVAIIIKNWALRFYAFNYKIERRYYWVGLRHTLKL
jgi:hypothetical protein